MAKQSSTKAQARPGKPIAVAPAGGTPEIVGAAAAQRPMLAEHLRVQSEAAALRKAASQPRGAAANGPGGNSPAAELRVQQTFYPDHAHCSTRPQYDQVHKRLTITLDLPCLLCGVRNSTLANPAENRYGARQIETHHHVIEWALADAVDVARFNKTIRPHLLVRQKDQPIYQRDMSAQEVHDWVDHSEDNLWVLCDIHHRHPQLGIHHIAYPIWCPQDLLRPDFADYVSKQFQPAAPAAPAPVAKKPAAKRAPVKKTPAQKMPAKKTPAKKVPAKAKPTSRGKRK